MHIKEGETNATYPQINNNNPKEVAEALLSDNVTFLAIEILS